MNNAQALSAFGQSIGLPNLAMDRENRCSLIVGDDQDIYLTGDAVDTILRLNAPVSSLTDCKADPIAMLEANYAASETGGGALSINRATGEIVYVKSLDVSRIEAADLAQAIQKFVKYAAFWADYMPSLPATADIIKARPRRPRKKKFCSALSGTTCASKRITRCKVSLTAGAFPAVKGQELA